MSKVMKFDKNDLYLIKDYLEELLEDYQLDNPDTMQRAIEVIERLIKET